MALYKQIRKIFIISAVFIFLVCMANVSYATTYNEAIKGNVSKDNIKNVKQSIDSQRSNTKQKIKVLKQKEVKELNKLYKSQGNMEIIKKELETTNRDLAKTKKKLLDLQNSLEDAKAKYSRSQIAVGRRLREIYKGERISFLNVLFMAENINTMLDSFYFQQIIADRDSQQLKELENNVTLLSAYTKQVEEQKQNVLYAMARIQDKKDKLAQDIYTSQYLIKKLQTDRKTYEQAERELEKQSDKLTQMLRDDAKHVSSSNQFTTTAGFMLPVRGPITSSFGWRNHPVFKSRKFHSGIDISVPMGTAVKCANSGVVTFVGWYGGYGKVVIVNHGNYKGKPTSTLYAHLSSYSVSQGAKVSKGQIIARSGSTGYSTGPHVHFEVRVNGSPVNPLNYAK